MTLASRIPTDIEPGVRLREYFELVRRLSLQRTSGDLQSAWRDRVQFVVAHEHVIVMTRRGHPAGQVGIVRSTLGDWDVHPFAPMEQMLRIQGGLLPMLLEAGRPVKIDELELSRGDPAGPHVAGMKSALATPVFWRGDPDYMIVMLRGEGAPFTLDELSNFVLTANLIGHAMVQAELAGRLQKAYEALDRELLVVGEIQRDLLPKELPDIPGVSVAAHYETSTRAGGDYYDFIRMADGQWAILIADVSGHGTPAAVVMAMMHAILHGPIDAGYGGAAAPPAVVLSTLNARLHRTMRPGNFVTAFYGLLDAQARSLRYAVAGHDPPRLLKRAAQTVEPLPMTDGLPLAIDEPHGASERTVQFSRGDRLLLYTDGITETFNRRNELFGLKRLDEAFLRCQYSAASVIDCVLAELRTFARDLPPADDRTLVAIAFD